jgi:hypothetical protein
VTYPTIPKAIAFPNRIWPTLRACSLPWDSIRPE